MRKLSASLRFIFHPFALTIALARFFAAIYIAVNPLWGYVWTVVLDWLDGTLLVFLLKIRWREYHYLDKNLDVISYVIMLSVGVRYGAFWPLALLLTFRFIGHILFLRTGEVRYYIYFPNLFEAYFIWAVLGKIVDVTPNLSSSAFWTVLFGLFVLKEFQEVYLHVYRVRVHKRDGTA